VKSSASKKQPSARGDERCRVNVDVAKLRSQAECSLLSLAKRMGQVDDLFEGIAREVRSARYAGSADHSDELRCSVVEGDSPKMLR
jgi:hypothetical protein